MVLTSYRVHITGRMDAGMLALLAEYDVDDVPAEVTLHGLHLNEAVVRVLHDRAGALGLQLDASVQPAARPERFSLRPGRQRRRQATPRHRQVRLSSARSR
jgi:hypothetical protein